MNNDARLVLAALIENPCDWNHMLILADALQDSCCSELEREFRWAAEHKRWPFLRKHGNVWDWQPCKANGESRCKEFGLPEHASIPFDTSKKLAKLEGRVYGDVPQAFNLLANALNGNEFYVDYLE